MSIHPSSKNASNTVAMNCMIMVSRVTPLDMINILGEDNWWWGA